MVTLASLSRASLQSTSPLRKPSFEVLDKQEDIFEVDCFQKY